MSYNRFLSVAAFILSLILAAGACERLLPPKAPETQKIFTAHMCAAKGDKEFKAEIVCTSYEDISVVFTQPEEIKSLKVRTAPDGYTVDAFGIENAVDSSCVNRESFITVLIDTIKISVFTNHGRFERNPADGTYAAEFTVNNVPVKTIFSTDGFLLRLDAKKTGFSAEFSY